MGREGVDWIRMDQGKDQWRAPVSEVMNLQIPQNSGHFLRWATVSFKTDSAAWG
jgi:hypothetical protein